MTVMEITEKACSKCGVIKPVSDFYRGRVCKRCVCDRQAEYYRNNSEKVRAYVKEWRQANPEKCREYHRDYAERHADEERERHRLKSRRQPREKRREIERRYAAKNPEKIRMKTAVRRSRKAGNGEFLIFDRELRRLYASPCARCGTTGDTTADHVIPIARGGRHSIGNLQPLCFSCNASKGAKFMAEYLWDGENFTRPVVEAAE
jgi:5-methylcytosine-specific restriction endonuclease McrA